MMQSPVLFDMVDHPDAQEEMMNFNFVKNGNVPFKLTTTQTIFTAAPTEIMKITGITATTNQTVSDSEIVPESALHNELLALIVLLCLLVIGVIIYFIFRSMVYIKKEKAQERVPINTFAPINLP